MSHLVKLVGILLLTLTAQLALGEQSAEQKNALTNVTIQTSMGEIVLELYPATSPITVANFLRYVDEGFYDGTLFHRVIPYFMIQGGGFDAAMSERKAGETIVNEAKNGLHNLRGTLAMARMREANSARAQFFINVEDNHHLNYSRQSDGYAVFGRVVRGMEIVDAISNVETGSLDNRFYDLPIEPILIERMFRSQAGKSN